MSAAPLRILFVTYADSPHAQSWAALLEGTGIEARIFSAPLLDDAPHVVDWPLPTYVSVQPRTNGRRVSDVHWLLPSPVRTRSLVTWLDGRFSVPSRWLRHVIRSWRPHIVHSLPMDTGGKLARLALETMPATERPRWVASSWGSDLFIGVHDGARRKSIDFILRNCDGFMADCRRDLDLAEQYGLAASKRALPDAAPGNGGIDIERFGGIRTSSTVRNAVIVPKAFEREHANRAFTVVEALRQLGPEVVKGYEIHLLMCSNGVRNFVAQMPEWLRAQCQCHGTLRQDDFFALLGRARVVVAPSLSDGTPNVMLEAMAAGALPVVSPLESTKEWIDDGKNGLMAHALYPDQIASAIRRAVTDNRLLSCAASANWDIVRARADRREIARQVVDYYRRVAS